MASIRRVSGQEKRLPAKEPQSNPATQFELLRKMPAGERLEEFSIDTSQIIPGANKATWNRSAKVHRPGVPDLIVSYAAIP